MTADHTPKPEETVVSRLHMVANTLMAEIVSCNGGMWTEIEVVSHVFVPSGEGVLPARMGSRLISLGVPESSSGQEYLRSDTCVQAGCSAVIRAQLIEDTYHRLQHGENPEHARIFVATHLYFETGYIWCSVPRRSRQINSWLQEIHEHERRNSPEVSVLVPEGGG